MGHDVCLCSSKHAHDRSHAARRSACCSHGWLSAAGCNTCPQSRNAARSAAEVFGACSLWSLPSSWWAQRPGGGRRTSLLTNQTVCTMGDRSLNCGLPGTVASSSHCSVLNGFALSIFKRTRWSISFAVLPLRSSSVPNVIKRAQGCKQAGCRLGQERRGSPPHFFNSKRFTNSHDNGLYPNLLGVNVSEVFLHTSGVSESP